MAPSIHKSARRQEIAAHNDGFLEGVCHAIDELREIAKADRLSGAMQIAALTDSVADRLEKNLFQPVAQGDAK